MPIRICHITTVHPRYDVRIFHKECRSLAADYEVHLIVADGKGDEVVDGIHFHDIGKPSGRRERMFRFAKLAYQKAIGIDAAVYHFHDAELLPVGRKLARAGKKVIYDSHEDMPALLSEKEWLPRFSRPFIARFYAWYERLCIKKFAAIVTVTPLMTERFKKTFANIFQITNYPIKQLDFVDNRKWDCSVCFAGGVSKQWMHTNILSAIGKIEKASYRLAGAAESSYLDKLKEMKEWEKVKWFGKIPYQSVHDFIQYSSVAIALNDYVANVGFKEGSLGNTKLFEYMQAGVPVICTDFHQWKKIVDTEQCGICVNPHDVNEIANAIQFIIDNPQKAHEMGDSGRKAVLEKYNWDTQSEILLKLYNSLLG